MTAAPLTLIRSFDDIGLVPPETQALRLAAHGDTDRKATSKTLARTPLLTPASAIKPRRITWAWDGRIPCGTLTSLVGVQGLGKSLLTLTLAAQVTRGDLDGAWRGTPKDVLIIAVEDSWDVSIVPRLMAAGADLDRVHRFQMQTSAGALAPELPLDSAALKDAIEAHNVGLVIIDPVTSRFGGRLDIYRDTDVRKVLEPLATIAQETGAVVITVLHQNKGQSLDPGNVAIGSRAFVAVPRTAWLVMEDRDDKTRRLFGQIKVNDWKRAPDMTFTIANKRIERPNAEPLDVGLLTWTGESRKGLHDAFSAAQEAQQGGRRRTRTDDAVAWLKDYLTTNGETDSKSVKDTADDAGFSESTIKRAADKLGVVSTPTDDFPKRTLWRLPDPAPRPVGSPVGSASPRERDIEPTEPTELTGGPAGPVRSVGSGGPKGGVSEPTGDVRQVETTQPPVSSSYDIYTKPPRRRRGRQTAQRHEVVHSNGEGTDRAALVAAAAEMGIPLETLTEMYDERVPDVLALVAEIKAEGPAALQRQE
jgi:hypothetical protein